MLQVFLGGSLGFLSECLFAPELSHVDLVQLHARVPSLSAALVPDDFQICCLFASVLCFFGLLQLSSD